MKNIFKFSICLLVLGTSLTSAFANNTSSVMDDNKKMEIILTLDNVKEGQQLYIKDVNGLILFKKTIETNGVYNNKFDLTALPNGDYFFEHENGFQIKIIPFSVKSSTVTFNKDNQTVVYKPVVRVENNTVYFSKLDLSKENVTVALYYTGYNKSETELLHSETIKDTVNVERIYSLSQKYKGEYKMVVYADGREYIEYFKL